MPISDADLWHQVHAQREDGVAAMFLIREVEPRADQPRLLVIEMPYTITDASKLPDPAAYRRLDTLQEQWIEPACEALGWTFVAWKSEDGSFFLYLYGGGDPSALLERLASFEGALGFFNDSDAAWSEYAALRELVEQAEVAPEGEGEDDHDHIHTADCDHGQDLDLDDTSEEFPAIDLTGVTDQPDERPSKPRPAKARPAKARPAKAKPAKARPAKARPAKAKATKTKATKAKAAQAKTTKTKAANAKAPKPRAPKAKTANAKAAKSASAKPASPKARPTASRATSRPAPRRAATAQKPRK
jgi:hypothetical protein